MKNKKRKFLLVYERQGSFAKAYIFEQMTSKNYKLFRVLIDNEWLDYTTIQNWTAEEIQTSASTTGLRELTENELFAELL